MISLVPMNMRPDKRPNALRKARLALRRQEDLLLGLQGFVIEGVHMYTREDIQARRLRNLHQRLTKIADPRQKLNAGTNAGRAADIIQNGKDSKWYPSRASMSHAGDDRRGIKVHLLRYFRQGKVRVTPAPVNSDPELLAMAQTFLLTGPANAAKMGAH